MLVLDEPATADAKDFSAFADLIALVPFSDLLDLGELFVPVGDFVASGTPDNAGVGLTVGFD